MDAITVDSLFALVAAVCVLFLLYGGWLCLRYGRAMPPFRGGRKAVAAAARAAACAPAGAGLNPGEPAICAQDGRSDLAQERPGGFVGR